MFFFKACFARAHFFGLCFILGLSACANNTPNNQHNFIDEPFTIEILADNPLCVVDFQLINAAPTEVLFLEGMLWLHRPNGNDTQLKVWNMNSLADLLGSSLDLVAGGVHTYAYDFSSYLTGITGEYSLSLSILGLKNQLPVVAQAIGLCKQE